MKVSKKIEYIKKWILNYCKSMSNEAKSLVVGVSGGIDSSVVSICGFYYRLSSLQLARNNSVVDYVGCRSDFN